MTGIDLRAFGRAFALVFDCVTRFGASLFDFCTGRRDGGGVLPTRGCLFGKKASSSFGTGAVAALFGPSVTGRAADAGGEAETASFDSERLEAVVSNFATSSVIPPGALGDFADLTSAC